MHHEAVGAGECGQATVLIGRVRSGVSSCRPDRSVIVSVSCMNVVQVSVVQIVGVAIMLDRNVAAAGAVRVRMTGMLLAGHGLLLVWGCIPCKASATMRFPRRWRLRAAPRTPS